jgi:class III poly(R)-hydroxyalkanoic acid synthase PhaE subunit
MSQTEQAADLMKSWSEAQKQLWEGWYDLGRKGSASSPFGSSMTNPWDMIQQGMKAWTANAGLTGKETGSQAFASQAAMMRNMEFLTKAWQMVAPKVDAGESWKPDLQKFAEQVLGAPTRAMETTKDASELLGAFMGDWGPLLKPWLAAMSENALSGHLGEGMLGGSSGLSRLFSLGQDEFQPAFERFADLPSVGMSKEQNAKLMRAFDAFVDLRKASAKYQFMLSGAMRKAVETTMERLAEVSKKGEKIDSVRELNRLWFNVADEVFTEMYGSEDYMTAQREMSAAGMNHKVKTREVLEMVLKTFNLPTRSELDDAYKTMYEMRKEIKALKKAVHAGPGQVKSVGAEPTKSQPAAKKKSPAAAS